MKSMRITLAVNPGDVSINRRMIPQYDRHGRPSGRLVLNSAYRSTLDHMALIVRQACIKQGWKTTKKMVRVSVFTRWPGPDGDCGSTEKAAVDALQMGGVVVNDKQCRPITLDAAWNCREPGIDVALEEIADA